MQSVDSGRPLWKVSLHGGHSGEFCEHACGSLKQVLEASIEAGFAAYGVSEHAPRLGERFLYPSERQTGWDVGRLEADFQAYSLRLDQLIEEFSSRLPVLKGFEAEVVPAEGYAEIMLDYRRRYQFDYMVGSVHHVREIPIDSSLEAYEEAIAACGGFESLAVEYYQTVARMVGALNPEVVGHLDVIRKNAAGYGSVETPRILRAAVEALEVIGAGNCILDLNTAGYRKGLGCPYPSPILVQKAHRIGISFCFGDDSHSPADVGADIGPARDYLLQNGIIEVEILTREDGQVVRRPVSLA